jgi:hypothetical protein
MAICLATAAAAAAACVALAVSVAQAGAAGGAGWTRPVLISPPSTVSLIGPQAASSATGAAAASFNEVNLDAQAIAGAYVAVAPPHGSFSAARAVPGAQEILAIAYSGSVLELLTASGAPGQPCCTTVSVIRRSAGGFGHRQTLLTNVGGGTTGELVPLADGRTLAVIAGPQRLWAAVGSSAGRFGAVHGLTPAGSAPAAVAAAATPEGGSIVVWTRGAAGSVSGATAGPGGTPSRARTLLTLAGGHAVDGVQVAPRPDGVTLAWTESWNDSAGGYHAQASAADVPSAKTASRPRALSAPGELASGLTLSSDAAGGEVAAWDVCAPSATACVVQSRAGEAAVPKSGSGSGSRKRRVRASWFGAVSQLGSVDAGDSPEVAVAPGGKAIVGWITGGRVAVAVAPRAGASRLGPAHRVSGSLVESLEIEFGPAGQAVATWIQGTAAPGVFVSLLR